MPYLIAAVFVAGIWLGYGAEYKISRAEIEHIELALQTQKAEAQTLLTAATNRIDKAEADALNANHQLDQSHESAIKSINSLHDSITAIRLRDPGRRQGGDCPVSTGANTANPKAKTDSAELSAELAGFLIDQSYQADTLAAYAAACYQFVSTHCGESQ